MMRKFIFYFLCTLSSFAHINCSPLTKEIVLPETINTSSFLNPIHPQLLQVVVKNILIHSNEIANLLDDLLKNSQPEVTDVLDVLNAGLGSNLLVVAENNIQIDVDEYENVLSNSARHISRVLYPDNHLQQLMVHKIFQNEITQLSPQVRVAFSSAKVPVEELDSLLLEQLGVRTRKDVDMVIQQKSILDELMDNIENTICNVVVNIIRDNVNSTITDWIDKLKSFDVSTDENVVSSVIAAALELVVSLIEQSWIYFNQWWDNNSSDFFCDDLLSITNSSATSSERKRRDVESTVSNNILSNRVFFLLVAPVFSISFRIGIVWLTSILWYSFNLVIRFR